MKIELIKLVMQPSYFELWLKERRPEVIGCATLGKPDGLYIDLFHADTKAEGNLTKQQVKDLLKGSPYETCNIAVCTVKGKVMEGLFHIT